MKLKKLLGPSPALYTFDKIKTSLGFRGGADCLEDKLMTDEVFIDVLKEELYPKTERPRRLSEPELRELMSAKAKRLTPDQRLLRSILNDVSLNKAVSEQAFKNLEEMYILRRKYKNYLRIKRFIPLTLIGPFTSSELSKMAYAAALGSKSVSLTIPGLIGYSLPGFFFFHMSQYYLPDKFKPICQICKFTVGAPFWIANTLTDGVCAGAEEKVFGEEVPIDILGTGGTIPGDLGDGEKLREILQDWQENFNDLGKKTY